MPWIARRHPDIALAVRPRKPRFALLLFLVVLLAFALREHYVLATIIDIPIRGDVQDYVAYALNLVHHGVYSHATSGVPVADAYRPPGYPWLLALCMLLGPNGDWYLLALQAQVLLGTATVLLVVLLARHWLSESWAIGAGLLLAIWPHHIAATGTLISEVAFAFALAMALYGFARAWRGGHRGWFAVTGAAFGCAWLINPVIALFPPCLAAMAWWLKRRQGAALLLCVFLVPVVAWGLRNTQVERAPDAGIDRATINFVQGSWPLYHAAHRNFRAGDRVAIAIMEEIGSEAKLLQEDRGAGLSRIAERLRSDPAGYAAWYLWKKPQFLWAWEIQLGAGGFYVLEVKRSPLDTSPVLRACVNVLRLLNPVLTLLALGAALGLLACGWRRDAWVPAAATGSLAAYLTLVHVVLQAEPRYANAYRGIEAVLVMTALALLAHFPARLQRRTRQQVANGTGAGH